MKDGPIEYKRFEEGVFKNGYDDSRMRRIAIDFFDKTLGLKFKNGTEMGIDLISIDETFGAEGENASWHGDRWLGGQCDIFNLGFKTLNIQHRKWHYWNLQELSEKSQAKQWWGKKDPGWNKNIYFRMNRQEDQICIVEADVILDDKKRTFALNRKVSNRSTPEDWICIKEEYVRTFNKQPDGTWVENGKYCGPSKEECNKLIREEYELKNKDAKKRAAEAYKRSKLIRG